LPLVERLNRLVIRCQQFVYRKRSRIGWEPIVQFVSGEFPRAVRTEWRLFWLCSALFWLPFLGMMAGIADDLTWAQAVLGPEGMAMMDEMYGSSDGQIEHLRSQYGSNFMMFCYYVQHNISIDFQIFAGGMAAGVGTIFFLIFNGVYLGAAAGYVTQAGDPESFWTFVSGHSSWELVGMVVAGMAGMRLGLGVLKPGRLKRGEAIRRAARRALPLVYGAGLMTLVAASVEGFWSAQPLPAELKYAAGAVGWLVVGLYLGFVGRGRRHAT
jgi:uncharacterized membrane protein SpoIIM required for sporulation